jgi:hypothetical protein
LSAPALKSAERICATSPSTYEFLREESKNNKDGAARDTESATGKGHFEAGHWQEQRAAECRQTADSKRKQSDSRRKKQTDNRQITDDNRQITDR